MTSNVTISFLDQSVNEVLGTSGISISKNWILTHGTLLRLKMTSDNKLLDLISNLIPGKLSILSNKADNLRVRVQFSANGNMTKQANEEIKQANGIVLAAWRCPLLIDTFANTFFSWEFGKDFKKINKILSSVFLVVCLDYKEINKESEYNFDQRIRKILSHFINNHIHKKNPKRGAIINIESTPFGNSVFINSISQGIISNILGINECVMLTDANTVPGCEGGPVYVVQKDGSQLLCGMVIAPLSWCRNEWVNYTLVACFLPCLRKLLKKQEIKVDITAADENLDFTSKNKSNESSLDESVVLIRCGVNWGTGTLVDCETGTILTCSHVVSEAPYHQIEVIFHNENESHHLSDSNKTAQLIYRTSKGLPYDIAILKVNPLDINNKLRSLKLGSSLAVRGEKVISAGFPFISSRLPTITQGNISSVSSYMLQTTCCVQSGASGGPIIRPTTGELLGIIVCNVITSSTLYPRLNMAIPTVAIKDPINEYIATNRTEALNSLLNHNHNVLRMWNFHLSSKM